MRRPCRLLRDQDYPLGANVKDEEGACPPERDRQFLYWLQVRKACKDAGQPILWVDTKKKEFVGNFKNAGQIWCLQAEEVNVHDFLSQGEGKAVPYGL